MSNEESKSDAVKEARELLETHSIVAMRVDKPYKEIRPLISALCDEVEELKGRNATQEESPTHLQSQFRVMKEAIEAAITYIKVDPVLDDDGLAVLAQLSSAITPKGSEQ